ncbi:MAG: hypothetical protein ACI3ZB_11490, partial [Prevotella sp.]
TTQGDALGYVLLPFQGVPSLLVYVLFELAKVEYDINHQLGKQYLAQVNTSNQKRYILPGSIYFYVSIRPVQVA